MQIGVMAIVLDMLPVLLGSRVATAQVEYQGGRRHDFLGCMSREIRDEVLEAGQEK
jgi:hypothetical protein